MSMMPKWKFLAVFACLMAALGVSGVLASHVSAVEPVVFDSALKMSPEVHAIVARSCADCHAMSNNLPWYAHVPPASWLVEADIAKAQKAVNLTNWSATTGKTPGLSMGALAAMCADVQSGRMPDKKYLWMHPEAKMSPEETNAFCNWTTEQMMGARKRK